MSLIVVTARPNPTEGEAMQEYSSKAGPILAAHGGKPVKRVKLEKALVGEARFAMAMVMEFPNAQSIENAFASAEYQDLVPLRERAFEQFDVAIASEF